MVETPNVRDPWLWAIAIGTTLLLLGASAFGPYGYFIDEFYYLACARRPALGYVDHPPLSPLLLTAVRAVLGESILALRLLPALAAGGTVLVTGAIAREWGGGCFAARLAGLAVACMPVTMVVGSFYSMNAFELLCWSLASLVVSRIARGGPGRLWLGLGVVLGVSFLFKHTIVIFVVGLAIGVAATPLRRHLSTRWPYLGAVAAAAIAAPNLWWQLSNDFATLEFYRGATAGKNIAMSPFGVLMQQFLVLHPLLIPLWAVGAVTLVGSPRLREQRWAGLAWWALLGLLVLSRTSRPDRITGLAPLLFVAGALAWERWLRRPAARAVAFAWTLLAGIALAPVNLPLLSPAITAAYAAKIGVVPKLERGKTSPLPQWLADRTGWQSMLDDVTAAVHGLPEETRARAVIYTSDYGHAGALELWGPPRALPRVISGHNSYYLWSRGHTDVDVLIAIGASEKLLRETFADVRQLGTIRCDYCMSWRNQRPIWLAERPLVPLGSRFDELKRYQ